MKYLVPLLLIVMIACKEKKTEIAVNTGTVHRYSLPHFADPGSFNNIKETFPLIEKIYRDHAEKNHYPAVTFGVIAGGQLVYSG